MYSYPASGAIFNLLENCLYMHISYIARSGVMLHTDALRILVAIIVDVDLPQGSYHRNSRKY